jgi:type II secretory ATPase GspE/PulE/Tfp pilus assembly ATPase PilB-like protein
MGAYEIFMLNEEIQNLIFAKESANVIKDAARKGGMRTLRDDALRKAAAGRTTLEEVLRLTVSDEEE